MAAAADLLRAREYRGIRIALIARLIVIVIALPVDQLLAMVAQSGYIDSLLSLSGAFLASALLLLLLQRTRRLAAVGLAAVAVDVALMAALLLGWWQSIGGLDIATGLILKSAMGSLMAVFVALNALTLRPLYPLAAAIGMAVLYLGLWAVAAGDAQTQWTNDYLTAFRTAAVSLPQLAGEFAIFLFAGALIVSMTHIARRLVIDGITLERASAQLGRYFSPTVRDQISAAGDEFLKPGGRVQQVAVLFCDIRDFTRLSEQMTPEELMAFVSDYQSRMVEAVFAHEGTLDKFIGDAIMATFGTPTERPDAARQAVAAAIDMRAALARLNRERAAAGKGEIQHGIGIHYGSAVVGNVGTEDRLEYTVMGDTVNVAALVAEHCKAIHHDLLISGAVQDELDDRYPVRALPALEVKGRREAVPLFAIEAGAGSVTPNNPTPDFGREG